MAVEPETYNICIHRGVTFKKVFQFDLNGSPWPLTGYSVSAVVRPSKGSATLTQDLSPSITDAPAGEITISLTKTQTEALSAADLFWDLVLENPSGERLGPYMEGEFLILETVTRLAD